MRFSIRDLLWLTVVMALGVAWWVDHGRTAKQEQYWRSAAVDFAVRLATETGEPIEFVTPDGEEYFLLGAR